MSLEDKLYPLLKFYEAAPQPVKSLTGSAYRALPKALRYGKQYVEHQRIAREVETWDKARIEQYQLQALQETLRSAQRAPFYRERFAGLGLEPDKLTSLDQLRDYPLLEKRDLQISLDALCNPDFTDAQRIYITTGGSSGVPVGFYLHKGVSRPKEQAYLEAQWARQGYEAGHKVAVIRGMVTSSRARGSISYYDATRNWLVLSSYHLTESRIPEYVAELNRFKPKHLHLYPSSALLLARAMEALNLKLDFPLVSLFCGSEKLTRDGQALLEKFFGAPICHWYGQSERVVLACQGRQSKQLYFWPTYGLVEFGEANEDGLHEIIGTSFHNHVMPLVRYRTGDFVRREELPEQEFPFVAVREVVGRDYEFLHSAGGRRISLTAINMHDRIFDGLLAVQFFQEMPGVVELRYQAGHGFDPKRESAIAAHLNKKLGDDFHLTLKAVEEVEKTKAGKQKWLITKIQ